MASDKLGLVNEVRESLRPNNEAQELLLRSALVTEQETAVYWLMRLEDETQRTAICRDCLADDRVPARAWTARVLSTWKAPVEYYSG